MFVELQDPNDRRVMYEMHRQMSVRALCIIFEWSPTDAENAVRQLWARYDDMLQSTRDRLVHEDPVNLAAEIAGMPWPRDLDQTDPSKTIADLAKLRAEDLDRPLPWIELKEPYASRIKQYNNEVRQEFEKLSINHDGKRMKTPFEKAMLRN
jgi:hypothetical protein